MIDVFESIKSYKIYFTKLLIDVYIFYKLVQYKRYVGTSHAVHVFHTTLFNGKYLLLLIHLLGVLNLGNQYVELLL